MATIRIRYLITRPGPKGHDGKPRFMRHYWQPMKDLREEGWRVKRLNDDPMIAITEAEAQNAMLDAWRAGHGESPLGAPARLRIVPGSIEDLIARYRHSRYYLDRRTSTQRGYDRDLDLLETILGQEPMRGLHEQFLERVYQDLRAARPGRANHAMRMLQIILNRARFLYKPHEAGYITHNPASKMRLISSNHVPSLWPRTAVKAVAAEADATGRHSIGTAIILNEWLGQNPADLLRLRRSVLKPGAFVFRRSKTGAGIELPYAIVPHLKARVDAEIARQAARGIEGTRLIISEETGRPYGLDNFQHCFAIARAATAKKNASFPAGYLLAIEGGEDEVNEIETSKLQFRELRHTAVTRLGEAGVDNKGIAAITGHSLRTVDTILERYLIITDNLAAGAFKQRLEHEKGTE